MNQSIHGAESWLLGSDLVKLNVSCQAGMTAPVEFRLSKRVVSPFSLSPWRPDEVEETLPELLRVLRGEFFCLPFGGQEQGPPHGEPANGKWERVEQTGSSLLLGIDAGHGARMEKKISLRAGETAIYYDHRISGLEGDWSYGNHPILDCSGLPEGSVRLSVSPFRWASVNEGLFSDPVRNEKQALEPGARFEDLAQVKLADGGFADLTRYPAREGNDDLVMMVNEEATDQQPFAWSAAVMDGYVWFSLKNVVDFPATLFWISNGGRADAPWSGNHRNRIGIEEVCSHFAAGVDTSRTSHLKSEGVMTTRTFREAETVSLRIVQAVCEVPESFGKVDRIVPSGVGKIFIFDESGMSVEAPLDWSYVL